MTEKDCPKTDIAETQPTRLLNAITTIATDPDQQKLFKMTEEEIRGFLANVEITDTGFDISPNFQSPGWGENHDESPDINLSDVGQSENVLKHELRHALHFFSCVRLFLDDTYIVAAIEKFPSILEDAAYLEWIEQHANEYGKKNIRQMSALFATPPDVNQVKKSALILGAITYQHAYFVDAAVCEAIASFEDTGAFLLLNHFLNRNVGLMLPGKQALEGYKNKKMQETLRTADPITMALMLSKAVYEQLGDEYWQ